MNIDPVFAGKLKNNGIPDEYVHSIERLIAKLNGPFKLDPKDNPKLFCCNFHHKLADDKIVYNIDEKGRLWVKREALDKFCEKEEIASLYEKLKQLSGWKWADHTSTTNPAIAVKLWHDKVDELAEILLEVVKPVY